MFQTLGFIPPTLGSVPSNLFTVTLVILNTFDGTDLKVDRVVNPRCSSEHDFFPLCSTLFGIDLQIAHYIRYHNVDDQRYQIQWFYHAISRTILIPLKHLKVERCRCCQICQTSACQVWYQNDQQNDHPIQRYEISLLRMHLSYVLYGFISGGLLFCLS